MENKKHTYIYVRREDYLRYYEKYGHARLDRWNRIIPPETKGMMFAYNSGRIYEEELFDGIETDYSFEEIGDNYKILFTTNSGNEYRFDLLNEPKTKIYDLAFSDSSNKIEDEKKYLALTHRNESKEVFAKLSWILKDITPKIDVDEYCIGATGIPEKDNIYLYMIRFVKGWEKRDTKKYPLGWALYFTLK